MMLAVKNLTLVRDDRLVLDDISFDLGLGKLCWLRGPNGSGKTTLLQLLARLLSPTSGVVNWRGQSAAHIPHYQQECFYLPHETGIRPEMTVGEHWQFVQR
ncbi:MAG: ATP-binding cassette domain-containing protein, partial [Alphaproteobacteria bacterium]|nr:ATP-binding cassette domain-containing protein [Alphaproteobacteria bacterium]